MVSMDDILRSVKLNENASGEATLPFSFLPPYVGIAEVGWAGEGIDL